MKRNLFKILTECTALVLLFALVAGCGGKDTGETEEAVQPPPQEQSAEEPAEQPTEEPAQQPAQQPTVMRETATSPYGFYTVQLSSWKTEAKAQREARRYQGMGLEAYVQKADVPGMGTWFRVRVGKYPALSEAQRAARALVDIPADETWVDNWQEGGVPPR